MTVSRSPHCGSHPTATEKLGLDEGCLAPNHNLAAQDKLLCLLYRTPVSCWHAAKQSFRAKTPHSVEEGRTAAAHGSNAVTTTTEKTRHTKQTWSSYSLVALKIIPARPPEDSHKKKVLKIPPIWYTLKLGGRRFMGSSWGGERFNFRISWRDVGCRTAKAFSQFPRIFRLEDAMYHTARSRRHVSPIERYVECPLDEATRDIMRPWPDRTLRTCRAKPSPPWKLGACLSSTSRRGDCLWYSDVVCTRPWDVLGLLELESPTLSLIGSGQEGLRL